MTVSFGKRLAELDAYLQMLIEQSELLDKKIELASSEAEKDSLVLVKNNLESLLGSIKHSIVLLQIAKVSINTPTETSSQGIDDTNSLASTTTAPTTTRNPPIADQAIAASPQAPARAGRRQQAAQRHLQSQPLSPKTAAVSSPPPQQPPPPPSSSSSSPFPTPRKVHETTSGGLAQTPPPQRQQQQQQLPQQIISQSSPLEKQHHQQSDTISTHCSSQEKEYFIKSRIQADSIDISASSNSGVAVERLKDGATICSDGLDEDDDDAFYDAADEQQQHHTSTNTLKAVNIDDREQGRQTAENNISNNNNYLDIVMSNNNNNNINNPAIEDGSIDWDALYEEEEEDLGSLENQGSVIKHLMSQIRIGMDLTKVVLPTFILERRSLLEMYADFFAHPDLFSSIPDYDTPEERMVQIVRWYLSAFHAGRKSSVAKKPYNPILGEIFLCHWNLDKEDKSSNGETTSKSQSMERNELLAKTEKMEIERSNSSESTASVGDIERFSKRLPKNSLMFVAEQVSHHPPVSAFYAENPDKMITCCAHIYTKSKYLGLSVGVHNIGQGVINVLKHNETYTCTFPSAYGRSILTVPWVELGGSVNITCEQTGYSANIEFVTKPFYGGKKHRVMGEILRPNKEPFITIDGEWNGCMLYKAPPNSKDKQVFVDTTCLPVINKEVRSISSQESFESRNVWKEVTRALKLHDVTSATAAKSFIEQRQRDLLKDRMEKGVKWKTRYFEAADDGWRYAKPLADRLSVSCESDKRQ